MALPRWQTGMALPNERAVALSNLYQRSGVKTRRTSLNLSGEPRLFEPRNANNVDGPPTSTRLHWYNRLAPELAEAACRDALEQSSKDVRHITHLITVSCTGSHAPGVDIDLIRRLNLRATVERTHIGFMGCHGALNGLRVARAIAKSEQRAIVLVCCVELCSLHFQYHVDNGAATSGALFGDGAAACIVAGMGEGPRVVRFGSVLMNDSTGDMSWTIGDHGFEMTLSARVPELLRDRVGPWIDAWLNESAMKRSGVKSWAIHPGGPRIVAAIQESLGLSPEHVDSSLQVLRTFGNMSSPTVLFVLRRLLDARAELPIVALAFGPGLAGEAMLVGA